MTEGKFKETEIGLIPDEWQKISLGELITFKRGHDLPIKERKDGKYPVIASNGIVGFHNEFKAKGPGVTIGRSGNLGKAFFIEEDYWPLNTTLYSIDFHESDPKFVYYFLKTLSLHEFNSGSAVPSLNRNLIHPIEIIVPRTTEQIEIAKILSNLDKKIEINQKMNQTLEEIGQAIFKHWFVHFEFPNEERKPYKSNGGEMVDSDLGEIPDGWEVQEIGNIIETTGGGTPSTKKEEYWEKGDIQWFSPRDITANRQMFISNSEKRINSLGLEKSSAKLFPPYSLMMTSRATVGELSINTIEASTNQGFITCIPNERLSAFYLYYWIKMNKEYIISLASGSTFREISKSTFRSLKVVIPDENILKFYDSLLEPIFNQIQTLQAQNENLSQIRDSLLPKLMSGKIRVIK